MFNTLRYSKKLEDAGLPRAHAEAHVQILAEIVEVDVATKQDLKELESRLVIKLTAILGSVVTIAIGVAVALSRLLSGSN